MMTRIAFLALPVTLVATSIALTDDDRPERMTPAEASVAAAVNSTSVLRAPRVERDVMPAAVASSPLFEGMGVKPATSRRLERQAGPAAWVVEGSEGKLCFVSGGSAGCAPRSVITERGLLPQIAWAHGVLRVEGVAADSVVNIRVTFQDDTAEDIPVRDGTFLLTTSKLPRLLEWSDIHGEQSLRVSLPPDLLTSPRE